MRFYLLKEFDFHLIKMYHGSLSEAIILAEINVTLKVTPVSASEITSYGFLPKVFL